MNEKNIRVGVTNKEGQLGFLFTRGGLREGSGRKGIGITKKVSITLTAEMWENIEQDGLNNHFSRSEVFRHIVESYYSGKTHDMKG